MTTYVMKVLPSRKTETQLERDQYGNLVKATQIERDAE